ncbi:putative motility protein [Brevibacillus dissolubilis]|uniref:putative motility protein n=1 Tax=Brevibacillus dissolubilis TaxID=1844116 RepID=UPI001116FAA7|nr:putative motility protein [Brevibacillus dissolubilis]
MDISSLMSANLASLRQTVSLSILSMSQSTQAAQAAVMLDDFSKAQATMAPHPNLGRSLDISV